MFIESFQELEFIPDEHGFFSTLLSVNKQKPIPKMTTKIIEEKTDSFSKNYLAQTYFAAASLVGLYVVFTFVKGK